MKTTVLLKISEKQPLTTTEARWLFESLITDVFTDDEKRVVLLAKAPVDVMPVELEAFRQMAIELSVKPQLTVGALADICGTGGDGKQTFNISTTSAFVIAAAGVKVAKHGNYGVSSGFGSSNLLEALGYKFQTQPSHLNKELEVAGITFLHAPMFHPAFKSVAPIRKALGKPTIFNLLGPLVNPALPSMQFTGVNSISVFELYKSVLLSTDINFGLVHSIDGYDEISLTGDFRFANQKSDAMLKVEDYGFVKIESQDLMAENYLCSNAEVALGVLDTRFKDSPAYKAVAINAGLAIAQFKSLSPTEGINLAFDLLGSKKAYEVLHKLLDINFKWN